MSLADRPIQGGARIPVVITNQGTDEPLEANLQVGGVDVSVANPVPVTPAATEQVLGRVGGNCIVIDVTPTLTVHATYVANDYVGTSGVAMTFANAARVAQGSGIINTVTLIDGGAQSISGELWLFDSAPTPPADSAAWSISDADAKKVIGIVAFSTYYASALNSVSVVSSLGLPFKLAAGRDLYGCFVTRGAPTYADGSLTFRLQIIQD